MTSKRSTMEDMESSLDAKRVKLFHDSVHADNNIYDMVDSFQHLPEELVTQVLSMAYDGDSDLIQLERVCVRFHQIAKVFLWKCIVFKYFPSTFHSIQNRQPLLNHHDLDYKQLYVQLKKIRSYSIDTQRAIGQAYHPKLNEQNQKVICPLCTFVGRISPDSCIIWHVSITTTVCKECGLSIKDEDEQESSECDNCLYMKRLTHKCQNCRGSFCSSKCKETTECICHTVLCTNCSYECFGCGAIMCRTCSQSRCQNCVPLQ